jgi:hypothetical protein
MIHTQLPYGKAESPVLVTMNFYFRRDFLGNLTNSVILVRERTLPSERPPLVGEVSANFWV